MKKLSKQEIIDINDYWNAANYLSVGQLYLLDNPLLRRKLSINDIKPNVVGHWGTAPGQNFIYVHLNRIIRKYDLKMIYISGPGHGGQAMIANNYLEGTYTRFYNDITEDIEGMKKLFKQFSFPGGVSSHVAPDVPGSINEGGELGYSLLHAAGAVLDNKDLIATCVIGDGEAETGPLATSWHINKFLNPKTDGIVLPILHRNGYKIASPTIFGRMSELELEEFFFGCGYKVYFVTGSDPFTMHDKMARALEYVVGDIVKIKTNKTNAKIKYPMIILTTPKGWTGPKQVNGKTIEGSFRSHQVPIQVDNLNVSNISLLEKWLKSYHPEELFDEKGRLVKRLKALVPTPNRSMGASLYANGGALLKELEVPNWEHYGVKVPSPGSIIRQDTIELGNFIRDLFKLNSKNKNFRAYRFFYLYAFNYAIITLL